MKILFVVPYPLRRSPSQRFRFEQYLDVLTAAGYQYKIRSFFDDNGWNLLYSKGNTFKKFLTVVKGFGKLLALMFRLKKYDCVFIHREATPIGPPVFEWFIGKVWGKKIIYDFDDAIWSTDVLSEGTLTKFIKWRRKISYICSIATTVSAGNEYLANFARQYNNHVVVNPTTIDTSYHQLHNKPYSDGLVIGWTGSHSTLKYLDEIVPLLNELEMAHPNLRFRVIANHDPKLPLKSCEFVQWSAYTEIDDLMAIDIGIMPLPNDEWSKGKCGFKALQYMSLEIPAVASSVGVNNGIIKDGVNGFLCGSLVEWKQKLTLLLNDAELRKRLGIAGRKTVVRSYSVLSNSSTFLSLFELSASRTNAKR